MDVCLSVEGLARLAQEHFSNDKSIKVADEEFHSERLLQATIALLSTDDDSIPIKGVREALKRFWHIVCQRIDLTQSFLDQLVAHIVNGHVTKNEDETSDEEDQNNDEENDMQEESDVNDGTESESVDEDDIEPDDLDVSADDALVDMINLRKSLRKSGAMDARRKELIMSTRYMDLLDVRIPFDRYI